VAQPAVADFGVIIVAERRCGSVRYPKASVAGELTVWRPRLRHVARLAQVRIRVIHGVDVLVECGDVPVSEQDSLATTDVIQAHLLGRELSFKDAVRARERQPPQSRVA
jgi:hypothetical protein